MMPFRRLSIGACIVWEQGYRIQKQTLVQYCAQNLPFVSFFSYTNFMILTCEHHGRAWVHNLAFQARIGVGGKRGNATYV